jgi:hypothetical protein
MVPFFGKYKNGPELHLRHGTTCFIDVCVARHQVVGQQVIEERADETAGDER